MIAQINKLAKHSLIFVTAKSTVILAPLIAATILSQESYGRLEWLLALSLPLGMLASMGSTGVIVYGSIGGKFKRYLRTATLYTLQITSLLVLFAVAMRTINGKWGSTPYGIVALQSSVICLQTALSARLKGLGKGALASVTESALYISIITALLISRAGTEFHETYAGALISIYAILTASLVYLTPLPPIHQWPYRNYRAFLRAGTAFMAGSLLMGCFMAAPRALLGLSSSPEQVADFALAFRWLSMVIAIHQFITTLFFRQIFSSSDFYRREKLLTLTVTMVFLGLLAVTSFIRLIPKFHWKIPIPQDIELILPIAIGMILWATTASLEASLHRAAASEKQSRSVALGCIMMLIVATINPINIENPTHGVAYSWVIGLISIITSQYFSLRAIGQNYIHLIKATTGICAIIIFYLAIF